MRWRKEEKTVIGQSVIGKKKNEKEKLGTIFAIRERMNGFVPRTRLIRREWPSKSGRQKKKKVLPFLSFFLSFLVDSPNLFLLEAISIWFVLGNGNLRSIAPWSFNLIFFALQFQQMETNFTGFYWVLTGIYCFFSSITRLCWLWYISTRF